MSRLRRADVLRAGAGALAAGVLGACGAAPGAPAGESQPAPAPTVRPATVTIDNDWTRGDRFKVVQAWLERANKVHPHIKTELRENAESQEKSVAAFAADTQGDLVQLDPYLLPVFAPKGALHEIASLLATQKFDPARVYDFPSLTHHNGKRMGLMVQLNANSLVYNAGAFAEAGLKEPAATWTWDDFVELTGKLNRPQDNRWATDLGFLYPWFWSANVALVDPVGPKALWDAAPARPILQWHSDLALRHRVAPPPAVASEKRLSFSTGAYAISLHAVPSPAITKAIDGKFEWNILPRPRHPQTNKAVNQMNGHAYQVTAKAAQRGVAAEAVQVLLEFFHPEIQGLYVSGLDVGSLPVLKAVAESQQSLQGLPSNMKRYTLDAIATAQTIADGKTPGLLAFHNEFNREYNQALNGQVTLEQAALNMTRACNAALAQAVR